MREGTFIIFAFENSTNRLKEILDRYQINTNDTGIRDAVIQRFEFTYSIALKTLNKYLMEYSFIPIKQLSFNEMIRTANQLDLLKSNLEKWTEFREMRNLTSHTYDEEVAEKVVRIVPDFYEEISFLLQKLKDTQNG